MPAAVAVFALTGDPPTNGHVRVIRYGSDNFDTLYVALADNPAKQHSFSLDTRFSMLKSIVEPFPNAIFMCLPSSRLLVRFASEAGAKTLLRGVRNGADHEYERMMAEFNEWLYPSIRTVCVGPDPGKPFVSSSFVKSLIGLEGWTEYVAELVPPCVMPYLIHLEKSGHGTK